MDAARVTARRLAAQSLKRGDPVGWFEPLYAAAAGNESAIQWADMRPNPHLTEWLDRSAGQGDGRRALVVGCGLGDDAEELARRGYRVVAFDVAPTAIDWCRRRFPDSAVLYEVGDVLAPPGLWFGAFDLVVEAYTLQALPPDARARAMERIAHFVAPGGTLLTIARGREPEDDPGAMPWPLTKAEFDRFRRFGLNEIGFEDYADPEDESVRRFRGTYRADPGGVVRAPVGR
ncbi:MAG: class I SAM-dependent methyltransferase [Chloroflexota bacterium]|nr:class I SAM-dependent methyltransferase [Chloroflexota bacterium]